MISTMRTKEEINYRSMSYGHIATIPAKTPVTPANNLPEGGFWVDNWEGMSDKAESWGRNYGFHVTAEEVEFNF